MSALSRSNEDQIECPNNPVCLVQNGWTSMIDKRVVQDHWTTLDRLDQILRFRWSKYFQVVQGHWTAIYLGHPWSTVHTLESGPGRTTRTSTRGKNIQNASFSRSSPRVLRGVRHDQHRLPTDQGNSR